MELLDIVKLKSDDEEHGVKAGFYGTIVFIHAEGVYTVEFSDEKSETIMDALYTEYTEDQLELDTSFRSM